MTAPEEAERPPVGGPRLWATRALGTGLLLITLLPVYRLLDRPETGRFGRGAVVQADANLATAWWGLAVVVGLGAALAFLIPGDRLRTGLRRWARALQAPAIEEIGRAHV